MSDGTGTPAQGNTEPGGEETTLESLHGTAKTAYDAYVEDPSDENKTAFEAAFGKVGEYKPPAPSTAPESYDLKLPENSVLDAEYVDKIASYAKERGLSNEAAQELLERDATLVAEDRQAQSDALNANVEAERARWAETRKKDAEVGGANEKEATTNAQRAVERFGTPELKQLFDDSGFGEHTELVRIFARVGKAMADDKFVLGSTHSGDKREPQDVLYGGGSASA